VHFDRLSLVLLNLLAVELILSAPPLLVGLTGIFFLVRVTTLMREIGGAGRRQPTVLPTSSGMPVARS
jgi:hypothetical protein